MSNKRFMALCLFVLVAITMFSLDKEAIGSYVATSYMTAILDMSTATVPASNDTIQRCNSESTSSDTVKITLSGDIENATITTHYAPVRVHVYNGATISDSAYVKAGRSFPMFVADRDSIRVIRDDGVTRVDWVLSPSKQYALVPTKISRHPSLAITHGDTISIGETYTYTQDQANKTSEDHSGTCVYFEELSIIVNSVRNNSAARVTMKLWLDGHLIANGSLGVGIPFVSKSWRFDSLTVVTDNFVGADVASLSLSWDDRP